MTRIEIERALSDAFQGGEIRRRELRLSQEEAEAIRASFPARLAPLGESGGKTWYEITFQGAEQR